MIEVGPVPVRPLPVRKGPRGVRQVEVSPGRWMDEAVAIAQGIPLTVPLPTNGAGPVIRRHEAPEVPSVPAAPVKEPAPKPRRQPTEAQAEAWRICHDEGMYWPDAARRLGTTAWTVAQQVRGYMRAMGITGPEPGRMDPAEARRRSLAGRGVDAAPSPLASEPSSSKSEPGFVVIPGSDHAPDIPGTIPDADPGHEMTTSPATEAEAPPPAVARVAPSAQSPTIGRAGGGATPSGGSEPRATPQDPPVEADGAATTSYRAGDGPPQRGSDGTTGDFPGHPDDRPSPDPLLARLLRERDEMEMARDELREMLDRIVELADQRPGRERYLDVLLSGLSTHPTDNIRDRIERALGIEVDRDSWADGYRRALGDVLDIIRGTRGTTYPQQDIIERIARLAIDVRAA